jgi:hypothetical protein
MLETLKVLVHHKKMHEICLVFRAIWINKQFFDNYANFSKIGKLLKKGNEKKMIKNEKIPTNFLEDHDNKVSF